MGVAVAVAFIALIALAWYLIMQRFQLSRWTILVAIAVLVILLLLFFRAEDEDEPASSRGGQLPASTAIVRI
jgi:Ca2+/Na+ antiporter